MKRRECDYCSLSKEKCGMCKDHKYYCSWCDSKKVQRCANCCKYFCINHLSYVCVGKRIEMNSFLDDNRFICNLCNHQILSKSNNSFGNL